MKFMLLSVFLDYECSNSTCNLPNNKESLKEINSELHKSKVLMLNSLDTYCEVYNNNLLSFVDFVWERYFYIQSKSEKTIQNKLDLLLQELRKSNMK